MLEPETALMFFDFFFDLFYRCQPAEKETNLRWPAGYGSLSCIYDYSLHRVIT